MRFGVVGEILGWDLPIGTEIVAGFIDVQANTWAPQIEPGGAGTTILDGLYDVTALVYAPTILPGDVPVGASLEDVPVTVNDVALLPGDVAIGPENIADVAIGTWAPVIGPGNFPVGPDAAVSEVSIQVNNPTIVEGEATPATLLVDVDDGGGYAGTGSGGESTVFTFRATITENDWTIESVEIRLGGNFVCNLSDQGGGVWTGATQLPANAFEGFTAHAFNDASQEAVSSNSCDVTVYATPTITSHADGAVDVAVDDTFEWIPAGGSYDIQISTDNSNESAFLANLVVNESGHGTNSYDLPDLDPGTAYYIRVRDGASDWSNALGLGFTTAGGVADAVGPAALADVSADVFTPTIVEGSAFTARHIVGAQYDHLYRDWHADFNPSGNWLQCIWFRPDTLPGAVRYVLSVGHDNNNGGWSVRCDSSDRLLVRYTRAGSTDANIGTFQLVADTDYLVCVYEVDGKLYFRVDNTEVGDSGGNGLEAPTGTNGVKINEYADDDFGNGFDAYYRNYAVLDSYNATEATALTEIDADIDAILAAGRAAQFSSIAGLNGTLTHLYEMGEQVSTEENVDRADSVGSLDFSSFGNVQSIDDSAI